MGGLVFKGVWVGIIIEVGERLEKLVYLNLKDEKIFRRE